MADGRSRTEKRRRGIWKKALFASFTLLALFLLSEGVLWMAGIEPLARRADPTGGFSKMVSIFVREGDRYRTRVAVRGTTFNDQTFAVRKTSNALRVFCLGGSSAYGFPWGAETSFCGVLQDLLTAAHPDRDVEVINAAGMSYAMHRLNIVADELFAYEPDLFVIYSGHNEFVEPSFYGRLRDRGRLLNALVVTLSRTRSYSAVQSAVRRYKESEDPASTEIDLWIERNKTDLFAEEEREAVVSGFAQGLSRLVRRCRERGVGVVAATVPCNLRDWRPERSMTSRELTESQRTTWRGDLRRAADLLDEARFAEAERNLDEALALAPDYAETYYLLGRAYEGLGRYPEAERAYAEACEWDASPIRRIAGINEAVRRVALDEGAVLVDIDRVFAEESEHRLVGLDLIEDYVHPTPKGHQLIAWHVWRAIEESHLIDSESRLDRSLFESVVASRRPELGIQSATWFYNQAIVLQQQGRLEQAVDSYRRALELSPTYVAALLNLARLLSTRPADAEEAERLADEALRLEPEDPVAHVVRAALHGNRAEWRDAAAGYRRALALDPDSVAAHIGLGSALAWLGDLDQAEASFERALARDPRNALANYNMARVKLSRGDSGGALPYLRRALETDPENPEAHNNLGAVYLELDRPQDAADQFRQAVEIRPRDPEFRYNLGLALTRTGDNDAAAESFQRVLELSPDHAEARERLELLGRN